MIEGKQVYQRPQADVFGALASRRQENAGRGRNAQGREVVLSHLVGIKTVLIGVLQHLEPFLENLARLAVAPFDPIKYAEPQL